MWPEYYSHIVSDEKFTNDEVLQFPYGVRMLGSYCQFAQSLSPKEGVDYTDANLVYLHNDRLKGEYVVNREFQRYKSYDQYLTAMEKSSFISFKEKPNRQI